MKRGRPLAASTRARSPRRQTWRWLLGVVLPAATLVFAYLLLNAISQLDWAEIKASLLKLEAPDIGFSVLLTAATYGIASGFELLGKAHEQHGVRKRSCVSIGFVAYSIAANLSSLLGNWGVRYRLYARQGLQFRQTSSVAVMGIGTNWSGFVLLAGLVFSGMPPELPSRWPIQQPLMRAVGVVLLAAALSYLWLCIRRPGRQWRFRGLRFKVPTIRIALRQLLLSCLVWVGIVSVLNQLLPAKAAFVTVMAVLFLSTMAALVIRAPAGVGVTEVVFVAVLGPALNSSLIVAALLAYRAVFQLLPLLLAALFYLALEWQWRRRRLLTGETRPA